MSSIQRRLAKQANLRLGSRLVASSAPRALPVIHVASPFKAFGVEIGLELMDRKNGDTSTGNALDIGKMSPADIAAYIEQCRLDQYRDELHAHNLAYGRAVSRAALKGAFARG